MKRFKRALITGASKGLGSDISIKVSRFCENLVLLARDEKGLLALKEKLINGGFKGEIDILLIDLSAPDFLKKIEAYSKPIDLLINNAGLGQASTFAETTVDKIQQIVNVNISSLTYLSHHYVRQMQTGGQIINIASCLAFLPAPLMGVYAASKAYVRSLSWALDYELRPKGVRVKVLCPGGIKTQFHLSAGMSNEILKSHGKFMATSEETAEAVCDLIQGEGTEITPGAANKMIGFLSRVMPTSLMAKSSQHTYERLTNHT